MRPMVLIFLTTLLVFVGSFAEGKHRSDTSGMSLREIYRLRRLPPSGACYASKITRITSRFGGPPSNEEGTVVSFENGLSQISYDLVPEILHSRVGDKVTSCVFSLPTNCPRGDTRGVYYRTHNWRTHENWTLPDSQHSCGGA